MEENHKVCPKCCEKQREEVGPEELMRELSDTFLKELASPDWAKRKQALDKLQKTVQSHGLLKDGDYWPLLTHLRRIIFKDLSIVVVTAAVQCITFLAKGIGKNFGKYAEGTCSILFEKFVEKRQKMTELLREAVDAVLETTKLEFLINTIIRLLRHPNPSIRFEVIIFLARNFPKCSKNMLLRPPFVPLFNSLKSLLTEGDVVIREKALTAMGAAVYVAGDKALQPYIKDLDLASKAKIEVYQTRAWEIAKTYNEMKFPYFRDRNPIQKKEPSNVSNLWKEHVCEIELQEESGSSIKSPNPSNDFSYECDKLFLEEENYEQPRKWVSVPPQHQRSAETVCFKEIQKELSLPVGYQLNDRGYHLPTQLSDPERFCMSSNSITDSKDEKALAVNKKQNEKSETFVNSESGFTISQFRNKCITDAFQKLNENPNRQELCPFLITYKDKTNEKIDDIQNQSEDKNVIGSVFKDLDIEEEESRVGFTKKEIDRLLRILRSARSRSGKKGRTCHKRKYILNIKKQHRSTAISAGFLLEADDKETQCTSSAELVDAPTQTANSKEVGLSSGNSDKPNSISCIVNCCTKCTRLLLASASPELAGKYLFPKHTIQKGPLDVSKGVESPDNSVYHQLVSTAHFQAVSEPHVIQDRSEPLLAPEKGVPDLNPKPRRSSLLKHLIICRSTGDHKSPQVSVNKSTTKPGSKSTAQQTDPGLFTSSNSLDISSKECNVPTCNKTTFVTTASQSKRRRRKRHHRGSSTKHHPIILQGISHEYEHKWFRKEFQSSESKRAMKVRLIRIE